MRLSLYFSGPKPRLARVEFRHSLLPGGMRSARRGKRDPLQPEQFSFEWSAAVQALSVLMIRASLCAHGGVVKPPQSLLQGGLGSLASALDYAVSKQPEWLLGVFGCDRSGICLIRRFVRRVNSNCKRAKPVNITVAPALFAPGTLSIYWDERLLESIHDLKRCLLRLVPDVGVDLPSAVTLASAPVLASREVGTAEAADDREFAKLISTLYCAETYCQLRQGGPPSVAAEVSCWSN